jgi:hypothetical protein
VIELAGYQILTKHHLSLINRKSAAYRKYSQVRSSYRFFVSLTKENFLQRTIGNMVVAFDEAQNTMFDGVFFSPEHIFQVNNKS